MEWMTHGILRTFLLIRGAADARTEVVHALDNRGFTRVLEQYLEQTQDPRNCGISRPAVDEYLRLAEGAGLSWPLPAVLDEGALERRLFPAAPTLPAPARSVPDWSTIDRESKRKEAPCSCSGRSTGKPTPKCTSTAGSVSTSAPGRAGSMWSSAKTTGPGRSCLWTTSARRCRWWTGSPARSGKRRSSSRYSASPSRQSPALPPERTPCHGPGAYVRSAPPSQ
jgi:hypothetical protein